MPAARRYKYTCISREREREYLDPNSSFGRRANSVQQKSKPKNIFSKRPRHEPKFFGTSQTQQTVGLKPRPTSALVAQMEAYFYFEKKTPPFLNIFSQMICFLVVSYFTVYCYKNQPHFNQMLDSLYVHFTWSFSFIEKHHVVIWSVEAIRASKEPIALRLLTSIQHDTSWGVFCQKLRKLLDNHDL